MAKKQTRSVLRKGCLLIAEPFMEDSYFENSVVLLTEHEESTGTLGFILNSPSPYKIEDLVDEFPEYHGEVYFGGPVALNSLHFLHTAGDVIDHSVEVQPGLYWGGDFEVAKSHLLTKRIRSDQIRFYIGYSGWSPGQLRDELNAGTWILSYSEINYLFSSSSENLWKLAMSKKSSNHAIISEVPDNLNWN